MAKQRELFPCAGCPKSFFTAGDLRAHVPVCGRKQGRRPKGQGNIGAGDRSYLCRLCSSRFTGLADFRRHHVELHKEGVTVAATTGCRTSDDASGQLREDEIVTQDLAVSSCSVPEDGLAVLQDKPFKCSFCLKRFARRDELIEHKRLHTGDKPYLCTRCSSCFKHRDQLRRHLLKTHNEGVWFTCHICQRKFTNKAHLTDHLQRRHGLEKVYLCRDCPVRLFTADELRKHMSGCTLKALTKRHTAVGTDGSSLSCPHCSVSFTYQHQLQRHLREFHDENECASYGRYHVQQDPRRGLLNDYRMRYMCFVCDKRFRSKRGLANHTRVHIGDKPFSCSRCSASFTLRGQLKTHLLRCHNEGVWLTCHICQAKLTNKKRLICHFRRRHGKAHSEPQKSQSCAYDAMEVDHRAHAGVKPYSCTDCQSMFLCHNELTTHWVQSHKKTSAFTCRICQGEFADAARLSEHLVQHASAHQCLTCDKRFTSKEAMVRHTRLHTGEKPFSCRHCSNSFTYRGQLRRHLLISHDEGTWFTCDVCEKKFASRSHLKEHLPRHGVASLKSYEKQVRPSAEKLHACHFCDRRFTTNEGLAFHVQRHTGRKPVPCRHCSVSFKHRGQFRRHMLKCHDEGSWFMCHICPRKYVDRHQLKEHLERHGDVKSYLCRECPWRFYTARELRKHQMVHSTARAFRCDICDRTFRSKNSIVTHIRSHDEF